MKEKEKDNEKEAEAEYCLKLPPPGSAGFTRKSPSASPHPSLFLLLRWPSVRSSDRSISSELSPHAPTSQRVSKGKRTELKAMPDWRKAEAPIRLLIACLEGLPIHCRCRLEEEKRGKP